MTAAAKRFVPSNPGGKPAKWRGKGMIDFIARHTSDGVKLAEAQLRILNGHEKGATVSHKQKAIEWLADRFMGKAVDIALSGDLDSPENPLKDLDAEQLRALIYKIVPRKSAAKPGDALPAASEQVVDAPQQTDIGAHAHPQPPTSTQTPETT